MLAIPHVPLSFSLSLLHLHTLDTHHLRLKTTIGKNNSDTPSFTHACMHTIVWCKVSWFRKFLHAIDRRRGEE